MIDLDVYTVSECIMQTNIFKILKQKEAQVASKRDKLEFLGLIIRKDGL